MYKYVLFLFELIFLKIINATNFYGIGTITAAGNSSVIKSYQFADKVPASGINYYRLKMIDIDGKYTYSRVVKINIKINASLTVYPNPATDNLFVQVKREKAEKIALQITDMQGKILHAENLQLQSGTTGFTFNTSALARGMYMLILKGQKQEVKTFIKE